MTTLLLPHCAHDEDKLATERALLYIPRSVNIRDYKTPSVSYEDSAKALAELLIKHTPYSFMRELSRILAKDYPQ